jgi:hypothetical protein
MRIQPMFQMQKCTVYYSYVIGCESKLMICLDIIISSILKGLLEFRTYKINYANKKYNSTIIEI